MGDTTDEMLARNIYLRIEPQGVHSGSFGCESSKNCEHIHSPSGITIRVKLDDEGVVVEAYALGQFVDNSGNLQNYEDLMESAFQTYAEMGVEVRSIEDEK